MAQSVEHVIGNDEVISSILITSSKKKSRVSGVFFLYSSLFTFIFSLNLPRDFSGEEIREKREKKR